MKHYKTNGVDGDEILQSMESSSGYVLFIVIKYWAHTYLFPVIFNRRHFHITVFHVSSTYHIKTFFPYNALRRGTCVTLTHVVFHALTFARSMRKVV